MISKCKRNRAHQLFVIFGLFWYRSLFPGSERALGTCRPIHPVSNAGNRLCSGQAQLNDVAVPGVTFFVV